MSLEEILGSIIESKVRAIVREELRAAGGSVADGRLYTLAELAPAADLSPTTLRRLRADGHLVAHGKGRRARYTLDAVKVALERDAAADAESAGAIAGKILKMGGRR